MIKTYLHISDLHLNDLEDETEYLREDNYEHYLDNLYPLLSKNYKIFDALFITGDILNKNAVFSNYSADELFELSENIIQLFCDKLKIDNDKVFICGGNHDIDRVSEEKADLIGARHKFNKFCSKFGNKILKKEGFYSSGEIDKDTGILIIDSTWNSKGTNKAGHILSKDIDKCNRVIRNELTEYNELIVLSHHPSNPTIIETIPENGEKQIGDYIFQKGTLLRDTITERRNNKINIWLSGHVHANFCEQRHKVIFQTASRLGTPVEENYNDTRKGLHVIIVDDNSVTINDYKFKSKYSSTKHAYSGTWYSETRSEFTNEDYLPSDRPTVVESSLDITEPDNSLTIFKNSLQSNILDRVETENLYQFGRFNTNEQFISLSWIAIASVLAEGGYFKDVVDQMSKKISAHLEINNIQKKEALIVGLDCWGACLTSAISMVSSVENIIIASRANGKHADIHEKIESAKIDIKKTVKACFLVSDVVASGLTINEVAKNLSELFEESFKATKWISFSVLCDESSTVQKFTEFLDENITCCAKLKMPIVRSGDLPNSAILPSDYRF